MVKIGYKILYLILPMILLLGIYGSQISYEKSGYYEPYKNQKSNSIMTMSIDNTSYEQGQTINVLGKVTKSSENVSVVIKIIDPTKNEVGDFHGVLNQFGIFTVFFVIPDTYQSGKYTLTAYYEGDSKKTLLSFDIIISNTPFGVTYITIPMGASIEGNNLNFVPPKASIHNGGKIIWINNDASIHTVISGKVLESGALSLSNLFQGGYIKPGATIEISPIPGNYTYFCKLHPWLGGAISVLKSPSPTNPTSPVTTKPIPTTPAKPIPTTPAKPIPTTPAKPIPTTPAKPTPSTNSNPSTGSDNFLSEIWKGFLGLFTGGVSSFLHHNNTTGSQIAKLPNPPDTPTGVKAKAISSSKITVFWNPSNGTTKYTIFQSMSSSGLFTIQAGTTAATEFTPSGLTPNTKYYYEVTASNMGGTSRSSSPPASATTFSPPPDTPTGVKAKAISSSKITVFWNPSNGTTKYAIFQSKSPSGPFTKVGTTAATEFTPSGLTPNTQYYYEVTASNNNGTSVQSSPAFAITLAQLPDTPTGVKAKAISSSKITVFWNPSNGTTKYTIFQSKSPSGPFTKVGTTGATEFTPSGLTPNTKYYYEVIASNNDGVISAPSSPPTSATTKTS